MLSSRMPSAARASPPRPPSRAGGALSARSWRTSRPRPAPRAERIANSPRRPPARAPAGGWRRPRRRSGGSSVTTPKRIQSPSRVSPSRCSASGVTASPLRGPRSAEVRERHGGRHRPSPSRPLELTPSRSLPDDAQETDRWSSAASGWTRATGGPRTRRSARKVEAGRQDAGDGVGLAPQDEPSALPPAVLLRTDRKAVCAGRRSAPPRAPLPGGRRRGRGAGPRRGVHPSTENSSPETSAPERL